MAKAEQDQSLTEQTQTTSTDATAPIGFTATPGTDTQTDVQDNKPEASTETEASPDTTDTTTNATEVEPVQEPETQEPETQETAPAEEVDQSTPIDITTPSAVVQVDNLDGISVIGKMSLQTINDYINNMSPRKPVNPIEGARHQASLYRALLNIINTLTSDFNLVYGTVLNLFNVNSDTVFHETLVFRFMNVITLHEKDIKTFQRLLNLIKLTANPNDRVVALKQVNIALTLEHISEQGKQNILNFYNIS